MVKIAQRFLFLDALRGIAALYVTLFHLYSILKDKTAFSFTSWVDAFLLEGPLGVQIFFVLSGFVIAYSIRGQPITLKFFGQFFVRRSIRLDPPYWMAIFLTLAVGMFSVIFFTKPKESMPAFKEVLVNLFYLQDILKMERIIHVSWTLCLEIQLYLFFVAFTGCLFWFQKKNHHQEKAFDSKIFAIPLTALFIYSLSQNLENASTSFTGLFTPYWFNFFIGCQLCWIHEKILSPRYYWLSCALMLLFIFVGAQKQVIEALCISLFIYLVGLCGGLAHLLGSKFFQYMGKISYSLYLTHWLFAGKFLDAMARRYSEQIDLYFSLLLLGVSLLIAFITAHLFYQWIELPSLRWSQLLKSTVRKKSHKPV